MSPRANDLFVGLVTIACMIAACVAATAFFKLLIVIADAINGTLL